MSGEAVKSGVLEILYSIVRYTVDGEDSYDVSCDAFESDELFESVEDAERWIQGKAG